MIILSPADRRKGGSTGMAYSISAESCLFHLSISFNAVKQQSWWSKAVNALAGGISINIHLRTSIGKVRFSSCRCRILTSFPVALTSFLVFFFQDAAPHSISCIRVAVAQTDPTRTCSFGPSSASAQKLPTPYLSWCWLPPPPLTSVSKNRLKSFKLFYYQKLRQWL